MRDKIEIGTSGWVYDHWRGLFYPSDLPQKEWFAYYADSERLANFAQLLPDDLDHAFEFREGDWFQDEIRDILEENGLSFVIFSLPELECPQWITADPVYLRFHGAHSKYQGRYGREGLEPWAERIHRWVAEGYSVVAYFSNDEFGYAIQDANSLIELIDRGGS